MATPTASRRHEPQQSDAKPLERAPDYVAAQCDVLVPSPRMAPDAVMD